MVTFLLLTSKTSERDKLEGKFSRTISAQELVEGDDVNFAYTVEFPNSRPRLLELVQPLPRGLGSGEARETRLVSRRAEFTLSLRAETRGRYRVGACRMTFSDLAGITLQVHSFGGEVVLGVASRLQRIDMDAIQPLNPKRVSGNSISIFKGTGSEFHSLREYIEGESIRRVNWHASARSEELWVNQFLAESSGTQIIILDVRLVEDDGSLTRQVTDMAIRTASSVAYTSLGERNAVGMFILSEKSAVIRPDYGVRQYLRLSEAMKDLGQPAYRSTVNMRGMADIYGDAKAQYIVISPLADAETMDSIAELAMSRDDIVTLVPLVRSAEPATDAQGMSVMLTRLRQETNARVVSQLCRTITWQRNEELSAAVRRSRLVQVRRRA